MSFYHLPCLHSGDRGRAISASLRYRAALPHMLNFSSEIFFKLSGFPSLSILLQHSIFSLKIVLHALGL